MRVFDWQELLRKERVPFIERGANVGRGEINIRCPFCGSADPSFHLGLSLETGWWACWRNNTHRGKSPLRLIMQLLRVPYWRARQIAGLGEDYVDPEGFDAVAARIMAWDKEVQRPEQVRRRHLALDRDLVPLDSQRSFRRLAWDYLVRERGFRDGDILALAERYHLHVSGSGDWAGRIVIPYFLDGELVTWTGRAIGHAHIRYKDLSREESLVPPKETIFNVDRIQDGGSLLVLVEGPMDAMKLDFYGSPLGVAAVGLSTNTCSEPQAYMLEAARDKFDRVGVMMDMASRTGVVDSMRMKQSLSFIPGIEVLSVPFGAKDAAELTASQIRRWVSNQQER